MNYKQEQQALEDAYARRLLIEYNIREVTTQRQAKNGTREFEFPVPCHPKYYKNKGNYSFNKLHTYLFLRFINSNKCSI